MLIDFRLWKEAARRGLVGVLMCVCVWGGEGGG